MKTAEKIKIFVYKNFYFAILLVIGGTFTFVDSRSVKKSLAENQRKNPQSSFPSQRTQQKFAIKAMMKKRFFRKDYVGIIIHNLWFFRLN
jgi:hypothetical protein